MLEPGLGDSGAPPRGEHKSEFAQLGAQLEWLEARLDRAASQEGGLSGEQQLEALRSAQAELELVAPRAVVFGGRAREADPDKQMYGPKMVARVLDFCARVEAAGEKAAALDESLAPVVEQLAAQAREAERQAEEERQRLVADEARAAVERAEAQRREREETERREEEEARRQEQVARERELERRGQAPAPLAATGGDGGGGGGGGESSADGAVLSAEEQGLTLDEALGSLQRHTAGQPAELADALQALQLLCANVAAHPEEPRFRTTAWSQRPARLSDHTERPWPWSPGHRPVRPKMTQHAHLAAPGPPGTIKLLNPHFQRTVARHRGGIEVLLSLGFVERQAVDEQVPVAPDAPSPAVAPPSSLPLCLRFYGTRLRRFASSASARTALAPRAACSPRSAAPHRTCSDRTSRASCASCSRSPTSRRTSRRGRAGATAHASNAAAVLRAAVAPPPPGRHLEALGRPPPEVARNCRDLGARPRPDDTPSSPGCILLTTPGSTASSRAATSSAPS